MSKNNFRIIQANGGRCRVFIDDIEIKGVTKINYSNEVREYPILSLEIVAFGEVKIEKIEGEK